MEPIYQHLGIAVLLGLLVGLQRERAANGTAGMRTFPLITVLGSLSALLAERYQDSWILAAGLLAVVIVTVVGHTLRPRPAADPSPGTTTDAAMLVMYGVGALVMIDSLTPVAIVLGGGVAVLLQFKPELHRIAQKLGDEDMRAVMQFVLITCIILPVLPNRNFGPMDLLPHSLSATARPPAMLNVLNPFETWLMVVLIVGLSLGGYIVYKFFGRDAGILLGGVLGGAISSTATTVSYARGARNRPEDTHNASIVILIASTIMYARMLLAVTVVAPDFLRTVAAPALVLMALTLAPALALWLRVRREPSQMPEQTNPTQLKSAIIFGLMYAVVLLALATAQYFWQGRGLYAVAFFSGLTEMDAVTLSTARMSLNDAMVQSDGWRMIVLAAMANSISKTALAGLLGGRRLLIRIAALFAIPMLGSAALLAWL